MEDHLIKVPDPGSMDHVEARIASIASTTLSDALCLGTEILTRVAPVAAHLQDCPPARRRAYAWALADKFGLSSERLKERIGR